MKSLGGFIHLEEAAQIKIIKPEHKFDDIIEGRKLYG